MAGKRNAFSWMPAAKQTGARSALRSSDIFGSTAAFGKAADSDYTRATKTASQAANRQTVQKLWNTGQAKAAQDNSTNKAYTAKLTGGANIDNSKALVGNFQNTFSGYKDNTKTQTERALQSKLGQGSNWSSPKSAAED